MHETHDLILFTFQRGISQLYDVERDIKALSAHERRQIRQRDAKPLADAFHAWMLLQRQQITDGSATAKALDLQPQALDSVDAVSG